MAALKARKARRAGLEKENGIVADSTPMVSRKEALKQIEARALFLKSKGNACCSRCGMPSGVRGISLKRIGSKKTGKLVCSTCLEK